MTYSEQIPNNLGIVFRREFVDLRDSTIKDFETYTGLKVNSQRDVVLSNRSTIMFRHIEELNNIQNVNLGWFLIEQADELDSDKEFFLLFGRLRRQVKPDQGFIDLGLPERSGFVIANAGDHWLKPLWKEGKLAEAELIEATTYDNADVLPKDFLDSLEILKANKPEIYKQYVLNDWSVNADQFILIPRSIIDALSDVRIYDSDIKRVVSCDPSQGGDECVIYCIENNDIKDTKILHVKNTMEIAGEIAVMMNAFEADTCAVDSIGIGAGICDRLRELGKNVIYVNSAEKAFDDEHFANRRAEIWWTAMEIIRKREAKPIADEELKKQLSSVRYKVVNSNGKIQLEPKEKTKERLGYSPDRADAYVYGISALKDAPSAKETDDYGNKGFRSREVKSGVVSAMAA